MKTRLSFQIIKMLNKIVVNSILILTVVAVFGEKNVFADKSERKVIMVQKDIPAGQEIDVDLDDDVIERVDVVVRRTQGSTETQLSLGFEDQRSFGTPQQVDKNENHVLRFEVGNIKPKD